MQKLQEFAFHNNGEFFNNRSIDFVALHCMISGPFEFIINLISGCDAEEIRNVHMCLIRKGYCKCFTGFYIQPGLLALTNKKNDLIHVADLSPCHIHDIDLLIFIICCYHQYRHRIYRLNYSQIFFHFICSFLFFLVLFLNSVFVIILAKFFIQ